MTKMCIDELCTISSRGFIKQANRFDFDFILATYREQREDKCAE